MGLLDSVIGALSGVRSSNGRGDMLGAVLRMLADDGNGPGVTALAERFHEAGMSHIFESWVRQGSNLPIADEDLQHVLGTEAMDDIAEQLGLTRSVAAHRLSQMLPYVIDKLTPLGMLPEDGFGDIGALMGRMASR